MMPLIEHLRFYCLSVIEEDPVVPCDATQLRLQILISMDEKIPKKLEVNKQVIPGLYFILDGRFYLINHTLISKISFPQKTNGSTEPPSAFIGKLTLM